MYKERKISVGLVMTRHDRLIPMGEDNASIACQSNCQSGSGRRLNPQVLATNLCATARRRPIVWLWIHQRPGSCHRNSQTGYRLRLSLPHSRRRWRNGKRGANGILSSTRSGNAILGMISAGTAGSFARSLGIARDYTSVLAERKTLSIDVGVVECWSRGRRLQRFFVNEASVGFGAAIVMPGADCRNCSGTVSITSFALSRLQRPGCPSKQVD